MPSEFSDFWSLYESSFPEVEKRDLSAQAGLFVNGSYCLDAFYDGDRFLGFIKNDYDYRVQSYQNRTKLYELVIMSYGVR